MSPEGSDWRSRWAGATALGEIAAKSKDAAYRTETVELLIPLLNDEHPRVRGAAAKSLRAITGQDFGEDAFRWQWWWEKQKK